MYYQDDRIYNVLNDYEGFKLGNIFKDLYSPYSKYIYNFVPSNDRQKLLLKIMIISFNMHDINLYLDIYPNDVELINKYNEYRNIYINLINEYEDKYEPIELSYIKEIPFEWVESPWPWEGV